MQKMTCKIITVGMWSLSGRHLNNINTRDCKITKRFWSIW